MDPIDTSIDAFFIADRGGVGHLYWPYSRETLCGKSKVNKLSYYWYNWHGPLCEDCLVRKVEIEMEQWRKEHAA